MSNEMRLETARLVIRSLSQSDVDNVLEVYKGSKGFFDLQTTEELSGEMIRSEIRATQKQRGEFAGIFNRTTHELIGTIAFVPKNFQGEMDYAWIHLLLIRESDRGKGFGREAYQAIEQFIFADQKVKRIGCAILPQYDPSLKFAAALGFERAGGPFKNRRGFGLYSFVKKRSDLPPTPGEQIWKEWKDKIERAN